MLASCIREQVLGDYERAAPVYRAVRARARARGDKLFEVRATQNLAAIAARQGNVAQSVAMLDEVLPLIERERNPDLYATLIGNLGSGLIALGEFDRALMLHTDALELFSARGDESQTARELAALAAIQFRSGNVERALDTIESALPLYERAQRPGRSHVGIAPRGQRGGRARPARHRARLPAARRTPGQERHRHRSDARAHRR